jgi:hypothetical protein
MNPDPGGPKTCGSGSPTLIFGIRNPAEHRWRYSHIHRYRLEDLPLFVTRNFLHG